MAAPNIVSGLQPQLTGIEVVSATLSPAEVAANTTAEQTFTITGLATGDVVLAINKPTAQAGLGIVGTRVTAADTIGITFSNNTATPITPTAAQIYLVAVHRPYQTKTETTFGG